MKAKIMQPDQQASLGFVRRTYKQSEVYAKAVGLILSETILAINSMT